MRTTIREWLDRAIDAADPQVLTREALDRNPPASRTAIAIGKAGAAMCRGAEQALGSLEGICVTESPSELPTGMELVIGDHPIPGHASFEAGRRVLEVAASATGGCLVLVSGGGSALCEWPREGVSREYLSLANEKLLLGGASILETNLVRGHLSALKCGGLTRAGDGPFPTYVLSDVAGFGPEVVASGPTLPMAYDPDRARSILTHMGLDVPESVWEAMTEHPGEPVEAPVTVVGDGRTAASAIDDAAKQAGIRSRILGGWIHGNVELAVASFLEQRRSGVTLAVGEASVHVEGRGRGGRNTHAALLAAVALAGSPSVFAALATDGVDGSSGAAGAMVDGDTVHRGGDPAASLANFDSAAYLQRTGDTIETGPTGTNVADLWVLWCP